MKDQARDRDAQAWRSVNEFIDEWQAQTSV